MFNNFEQNRRVFIGFLKWRNRNGSYKYNILLFLQQNFDGFNKVSCFRQQFVYFFLT